MVKSKKINYIVNNVAGIYDSETSILFPKNYCGPVFSLFAFYELWDREFYELNFKYKMVNKLFCKKLLKTIRTIALAHLNTWKMCEREIQLYYQSNIHGKIIIMNNHVKTSKTNIIFFKMSLKWFCIQH